MSAVIWPKGLGTDGAKHDLGEAIEECSSYPPLAKQLKVQGTVRFAALIGVDGHLKGLTVESGHPLLVESAQTAVQQWVYQPTLLNGNPVEVLTAIDVNYTLAP